MIKMNGSYSLIPLMMRYLVRGRYVIQCDVELDIAASWQSSAGGM